MRMSTRLRLALIAWFILEVFVFSWVVQLIGGAGALLLTLIGGLFGWTLLKRAGASAFIKLRATVEGRVGAPDRGQFFDETLTTIGALALLLPGFLSDIVGVILAIPAARRRIAKFLGRTMPPETPRPKHRTGPTIIDLDPADWRPSDVKTGDVKTGDFKAGEVRIVPHNDP